MLKTPITIATTSLLTAALAGIPPTASVAWQHFYLDSPAPYIWQLSEDFKSCTSSSQTLPFEEQHELPTNAKRAAYVMFGEMRGSTLEEQTLYARMLSQMSIPLDLDIFSL